LNRFLVYVKEFLTGKAPNIITPIEMMTYTTYLEKVRDNGNSAITRQLTVLKNFYKASVSMGFIEMCDNPMYQLPIRRKPYVKVARSLPKKDILEMLNLPDEKTVMGIRDKALMVLLYGTGIRVSECSGLNNGDVDFNKKSIFVIGKGGHERTVPLTDEVILYLKNYLTVRGIKNSNTPFFISRKKKRLSRGSIYDRIKLYGKKANIESKVSPHRLRHSFATHLVHQGERIQDVQALLGHKHIASTQRYFTTDSNQMRAMMNAHPIKELFGKLEELIPNSKLPFGKRNRGMFQKKNE
jgi:integrase/recombinase XerC